MEIFLVPLCTGQIKENSSFSTSTSNQKIKEQAILFHKKGEITKAIKYYQYLIDSNFKDPSVFSNYAIILYDLGKLKKAEQLVLTAIKIKPDLAEAHNTLGNILRDQEKLNEAERSFRKAIEINPSLSGAYSNLGNVLSDLGKLKEAELNTRKAIDLDPSSYSALSNLGSTLIDLGKLNEAEISLRKAIKIEPKFAEAYFNLSFIELLKGDYESGQEHYEFRFKKKNPSYLYANPIIKRLDDTNFKKVEKLLVVSEQGLGDTLQYMRYIPYLKKSGLNVSFCAQPKLHTLIKASNIDANPLTPENSNKVSEGYWLPLLSIPRYLKVSPKNPIITEPYIYPKDELVQKWRNILYTEKKPIIGINWQGNTETEKTYHGRSIPLEIFSILLNSNDILMLSLQKGFGSEQIKNCSFKDKFIKCQNEIDSTWDFLENAAIISNCDLIITCDTSIAHLAGGMGKKVWLLLRERPFWTWGLRGDRTFWYPSMKLFRQKQMHNWPELMTRVSKELKKEIEARI